MHKKVWVVLTAVIVAAAVMVLAGYQLQQQNSFDSRSDAAAQLSPKMPVNPQLRPGWPQTLDSNSDGTTDQSYFIADDLDGDGQLEIIASSQHGTVYAWNVQGQLLPGWPVQLGQNLQLNSTAFIGIPAVADLNGDGMKEIAVVAARYNCNFIPCTIKKELHLLNKDGTEVSAAWPKTASYYEPAYYTNPIIDDLNNDGTLEVISFNLDNNSWYTFDYAGTATQLQVPQGSEFFGIGNLDGIGAKELIVIKGSTVYAYRQSGQLMWSRDLDFPESPQADVSYARPTLVDLNGNGTLEVIVATGPTVSPTTYGKVWVFSSTGNNYPGWPQSEWITKGNVNRATVAVGNVDADSELELAWGTTKGVVLVAEANGTMKQVLYGKTVSNNFNRGGAIADITGDGIGEVIFGSSRDGGLSAGFFAWSGNGDDVPGWPLPQKIFSTPQLVDLDNNGILDLIGYGKDEAFNDKLFIWQLTTPTTLASRFTSMYGFNVRRTQNFAMATPLPSASPPSPPNTCQLSTCNQSCQCGGFCTGSICTCYQCVQPKKVFLTSTAYPANLGGLAGADAKCQTAAAGAGLTGTYKAWLSTSTTNAADRILDASYALVDGSVVVNTKSDLIDGTIDTKINRTELNTVVTGADARAFTGTKPDGTKHENTCADWTAVTNTLYARWGNADQTDSRWTLDGNVPCSYSRRLYCFQVAD